MTRRSYVIKFGAMLLGMIILPLTQIPLLMANKIASIFMIISVLLMGYVVIGMYFHFKKIGYFYELKELTYLVGDKEGLKENKKGKIMRAIGTFVAIIVVSFIFRTHYPLVILFIILFLVNTTSDYIEYQNIKKSLEMQ